MQVGQNFSELLQSYFRSKQKELLATSDLAIVEHTGLRGGHREQLIRTFLSEILPKRFEIGRGMIYGYVGRSHECDIVIWDANNYPSLRMADHSLFFAESVKGVLEIKTNWNSSELEDIKSKCEALNRMIISSDYNSLADELIRLKLELWSLRSGKEHDGMLIAPDRIGTGTFVFRGGQSLWEAAFTENELYEIDDKWPDVMLLVEAGLVIRKRYEGEPAGGGVGLLELIKAGPDALLVFTSTWLSLLTAKSIFTEDPVYFERYIDAVIKSFPVRHAEFPVLRPLPGRIPVWRTFDDAIENIEDDKDQQNRTF